MMKTTVFKILLLLFAIPGIALAKEGPKGKYTKEKKINKIYTVNSNASLSVDNQYGSVYITTWDENKIAIDVVITVSADKEDYADKRLSSIDVAISATNSNVSTRTKIGSFSGKNVSMEINYTIKIPKKGNITVKNQYGAILLGKIYSDAALVCEYGDIKAEELNGNNNAIKITYCGNSKIGYMKGGAVKAQYSELNLEKGNSLTLRTDYTKVVVNKIEDITYNSNYGEINIANAEKITGKSDYVDTKIGNVDNLLTINTNYGTFSVKNKSVSTKSININSTYTGIHFGYNENYPFDFEFYTEYSRVNGASGLKFTHSYEKDSEATYKGYNKSSGLNSVFIKSEYGNINLNRM